MLNPFKLYPVIGDGLDTLIVDKNMSLRDLPDVLGDEGRHERRRQVDTVPIGNANYYTPNDGDALKWDMTKAKPLFDELKKDQKVTVS